MIRLNNIAHTRALTAPETPLQVQSASVAAGQLLEFMTRHSRLFLLTGAGVSTDSGIPDYRDHSGAWKHSQPVQHRDFLADAAVRRRYWARSLVGWPVVRNARPNDAHRHVEALEQRGHVGLVVTQNVDRLHQRAGSRRVIDLHGRADRVVCTACGYRTARDSIHDQCLALNPAYRELKAAPAPDGDAVLEMDFSDFRVVDCPKCGGVLKPDVVFFGDHVPRPRVDTALQALEQCDGLLVIGSSLMVYSGYRFCRQAHELGKPIATLNMGATRADPLASLKLNARIGETLSLTLAAME